MVKYLIIVCQIFSSISFSQTVVNAQGIADVQSESYVVVFRKINGVSVHGVIDTSGKEFVSMIYHAPDGLNIYLTEDVFFGRNIETGALEIIDLKNPEKSMTKNVYDFRPFENSCAIVRREQIRSDLEQTASYINRSMEHIVSLPPNSSRDLDKHGVFYEGMARILFTDSIGGRISKYDKGYGFIDTNGKTVIPAEYSQAGDFHEGLVAVQKTVKGELKWGFIDPVGNTIIDFKFTNRPTAFSEGVAAVRLNNGLFQYFDKQGKILSVINCEFVTGFFKNQAIVKISKGRFQLINNDFEVLQECTGISEIIMKTTSEQNVEPLLDLDRYGSVLVQLDNSSRLFSLMKADGSLIFSPGYNSIIRINPTTYYVVFKDDNGNTKEGLMSAEGKLKVEFIADRY